ncbi:hypothetical protein EI42_01609 [Thermosporothrix hazakensis]|uniref:Uncharacterized protein n=1 Tax=Thermosporothrix hazakensis TaxID=644383 RepID=A0A326UBX0_THEHA|nr:hypothetical protein [Thermosporothrix hazakensis]PZW33059.1 hypothetical protein EI42_01609 [Thermosporothrix hazakensis]
MIGFLVKHLIRFNETLLAVTHLNVRVGDRATKDDIRVVLGAVLGRRFEITQNQSQHQGQRLSYQLQHTSRYSHLGHAHFWNREHADAIQKPQLNGVENPHLSARGRWRGITIMNEVSPGILLALKAIYWIDKTRPGTRLQDNTCSASVAVVLAGYVHIRLTTGATGTPHPVAPRETPWRFTREDIRLTPIPIAFAASSFAIGIPQRTIQPVSDKLDRTQPTDSDLHITGLRKLYRPDKHTQRKAFIFRQTCSGLALGILMMICTALFRQHRTLPGIGSVGIQTSRNPGIIAVPCAIDRTSTGRDCPACTPSYVFSDIFDTSFVDPRINAE